MTEAMKALLLVICLISSPVQSEVTPSPGRHKALLHLQGSGRDTVTNHFNEFRELI